MSTNDLVILNQILDKQRQEFEPSLNPAQYFEIFVSELLLRGYADLNDDEVGSGVVAGPADGGIDSVYLFVNGLLIQEDTVLPDFKKNISVELVVIQAKTESTFAETPVDKLAITTNELLDFGKDLSTLTAVYNQDLINIAQRFMDTYKSLAVKRPSLSVQFYYVSKGEEVHPNVSRKGAILERSIADRFPNTTCTCHFIGARELLTLAYKTPPQTLELPCSEVLPVGNTGYICTVERRDYIKFITDDKNQLLIRIFESNVRDYQGSTEVNEAIRSTLVESKKDEDFWWLNNGVTIVGTNASIAGKTLTIDDPQIVNGLQTSQEIYDAFVEQTLRQDTRKVLVRVIASLSPEIRDRIITATNSQNYIPPSSLRATESVHRDIEEFFKANGLFYDRRKNFYRNQGKPNDKIVSIPGLAQAVMAILLQKPDYARARPSSLLKSNDDYKSIFAPEYSPYLYLFCARAMKEVERFLRSDEVKLDRKDQANIKFYVGMFVACIMARSARVSHEALAQLQQRQPAIDMKILRTATADCRDAYSELGATDQVAKGTDLVIKVQRRIMARIDATN